MTFIIMPEYEHSYEHEKRGRTTWFYKRGRLVCKRKGDFVSYFDSYARVSHTVNTRTGKTTFVFYNGISSEVSSTETGVVDVCQPHGTKGNGLSSSFLRVQMR